MNKKLQSVLAGIRKNAKEQEAERARLLEGIAAAEAELVQADADKQSAMDAQSYSDAAERGRRAADVLEFNRGALENQKRKPHMSRAEYNAAAEDIHACAVAETDAFREKAAGIAAQLKEAYGAYSQAMEEIDIAAVELDKVANVLQTEYCDYPAEWKHYATRYGVEKHANLYIARESQLVAGDSVRVATWNLIASLMGWRG